MIRPSAGFYVTAGVITLFGSTTLLLGGYWNLRAHKTEVAVIGILIGVAAFWSAIRLFRRAKMMADHARAEEKSAEADDNPTAH